MTTAAAVVGSAKALRFWNTTNGKKAVMAATGGALFGFVIAHLAGNLQIFLGPEKFNGYAHALHALGGLLWGARAVLLICVGLHIWSTIQLTALKNDARPARYVKWKAQASSYASRTMYMSGPIIAAFVVYHLMQFTFGVGGTRYNPSDPYGNVITGFRVPLVSIAYVIAMGLLCLHLRHGLWSALQTLGFYHPRYTPRVRSLATVVALLIFFGFASIPVAVLAGVIPQIF
jgi:succinate dehydrogenase / fumarate reductase, cytochrome b subunit